MKYIKILSLLIIATVVFACSDDDDPKPPTVDFTYDINKKEVLFVSETSNVKTYKWDFGDGSTSTLPNPKHEYENHGTYEVTLNVTGDGGKTSVAHFVTIDPQPPVIDFSFKVDKKEVTFTSEASNVNTYQWDFGDGKSSTEENPVHVYEKHGTFKVVLKVAGDGGNTSVEHDIEIEAEPPTADFSFTINNNKVTFNSVTTNVHTYEWNFGDGKTSDENNPTHVYQANGTYKVVLVATGDGGKVTVEHNVVIDVKLPTVDFNYDIKGTEVIFTSETTNVNTYQWNFGDGKSSSEENPVHAYETPGVYKVTLNVSGLGGNLSASKDIEILETTEYLLTGGAAHLEGKTWKMKYAVSDPAGKEGIGSVDNSLAILLPMDEDGFLDYICLPGVYDDEFTFVFDGSYRVNNTDGNSLMSLLYAALNHQEDIKAVSCEPDIAPFADVMYAVKSDATWALSEEDFDVDAAIVDPATGDITSAYTMTFSGHTSLDLEDYFGYKEFVQGEKVKVIIKEISETEMTVVMTIHTATEDPSKATYMFHFTFGAVPY